MTLHYTRARYATLRGVADADPMVSRTDSAVMTDLVNAYLIDAGYHYRLTSAGEQLLADWEHFRLLDEHPYLIVCQARRVWRCECAGENAGYQIELAYPPDQVPAEGPRITQRVHYQVSGAGARAYAEKLRRNNLDGEVSILAIPNPDYRPGCPASAITWRTTRRLRTGARSGRCRWALPTEAGPAASGVPPRTAAPG
jgi:hypothetical protein